MELDKLGQAMPASFAFYHLGVVEPMGPASAVSDDSYEREPLPEDCSAVSFQIQGDFSGNLAILFDNGLDPSVYVEMGNVIASRFVTGLAREQGMDVMISPPQSLSVAQLERLDQLLRAGARALRGIYRHLNANGEIQVHWVLLLASGPEVRAGSLKGVGHV